MERTELRPVLDKLEVLESRTFSEEQTDAWFDILGPHTQQDALAAVISFHSKPFRRPAYPGDIKSLILETEDVRLRRCGTLEANGADWINGPPKLAYRRLRILIGSGEWNASEYKEYRQSGLPLDEFLASREVAGVG